jgi:hypothetical protein
MKEEKRNLLVEAFKARARSKPVQEPAGTIKQPAAGAVGFKLKLPKLSREAILKGC